MKPRKIAGPSEVCQAMICASGEVEISVMMDTCRRMLDEKEMPDEWQTNVLIPIFKRRGTKL